MASEIKNPPAGDDEEPGLFSKAMSGIKRLQPGHVTPQRPLPPTQPRQREADDRAVMQELLADPGEDGIESGDSLLYRADGVQDSVLRKLRRGQYRIERELDLHGLNRATAQQTVSRFLSLCQDQDARCVRIIHGKGNGSPNSGPVIKRALDGWLRKRNDVVAYCSARVVDGGTGAVYVLLRAPVRPR
ncbi:MAG: Smr/MutS family protein [Stenotrophobium sp.]